MLKSIIYTSLLMISTFSYAASNLPVELYGDWDISAKICADVNKQVVDSETRIEIKANQIVTYREICNVSVIGKSSPALVDGTLTCGSNEDDSTTKRKFNIRLHLEDKEHLTWNKTAYIKCSSPRPTLSLKAVTVMPLCTYTAKISAADKKTKSGVPFSLALNKTTVSAILRQDRANYHQFNIRDSEDQSDCVFSDKAKRSLVEKYIESSMLDATTIKTIVEQNPILNITVFSDNTLTIKIK